ncbi:MAG: CRISPR-associated endonuclease Cas2 [Deltaproteobacteria bacterium]|nr:CRISPR-associated endonuclease Cas2 [Deltaproteobacteria bacterium]
MLAIVAYDMTDNRRRSRMHRCLKDLGLNTQKSVFECEVDGSTLAALVALGRELIDPDTDSFRIYRLCARCQRKVAVSGLGLRLIPLDFEVL